MATPVSGRRCGGHEETEESHEAGVGRKKKGLKVKEL